MTKTTKTIPSEPPGTMADLEAVLESMNCELRARARGGTYHAWLIQDDMVGDATHAQSSIDLETAIRLVIARKLEDRPR